MRRRDSGTMQHRNVRFDLLDPAQVAIYRAWTPERRLQAGLEEMNSARSFLTSTVVSQFPDWSAEEVRREVSRRILGHDR
jgi:hypothetical protein